MGRTRRARSRRKLLETASNMSNELTIISLTKWLVHNNWHNTTHLSLRNFPTTGRGVTSSRQIKENDVLITVPCDLLITYNAFQGNLQEMISPSCSHGLKIHDLLSLFLMLEKRKEKSLWKEYIDSLPSELPVLPWLASSEEISLYPADLQVISEKNRENFTESMSRAKRSIYKPDGCVFDENLFKWSYVLVNTRAVYVDPQVVIAKGRFLENLLIDQPSMALCPFLDMFNHHFLAETEAKITEKDGKLVYQLRTFTKHRKYDQIFISYGAHDNTKLVMEYGFFIPGNILDVVKFELQNILDIFNINLDQKRYKFIIQHKFNSDLYVGYNGVSFNLKAVFFILFDELCHHYSAIIFSDCYPQHFLHDIPKWAMKLLSYKLTIFERDCKKLEDISFVKSENAELMVSFLKYRIHFVNELRNKNNF